MSDQLINNIGVRIKAIREAKGLDQESFATAIGSNRTTISMWESGVNKPRPAFTKKICDIYNISPTYMYEGKGDMFKEDKPKEATVIDNFLLRQIELKDSTIATLQATINHLLSVPGKLNVLEIAEAPIKPLWPEGTFSGTSLVA